MKQSAAAHSQHAHSAAPTVSHSSCRHVQAAIVNITSGLAFIPYAIGPIYGATKAAMHSYTVAMRPHYANSNVHIVEIAPPPVKTNFESSKGYGEDCDAFCDHAFARFKAGEQEIG